MASTTHFDVPGVSAETLRPASVTPNPEPSGGLDAASTNLDGYLNEPVRDILARLGLASGGAPANPAGTANSAPPQQPQSAAGDASDGGGTGGFDPSQMIQPVMDALGSLGSGQMGQPDPTQSFDGIGQALESAGSQVQQALSGLGDDWQGDAGAAAQTAAQAALADGSKVADQAASLRSSLATAAAAVQDAQARLIEIVNVFWAKIAAIGPNIIFPWGIAAAIAAATEAVTSTGEVMAETQGTLATQAAAVTAAGAPVDVTSIPALGAGVQGLSPLVQLASSVTSPVLQAIGSASNAAPGAGSPADAPSAPLVAQAAGVAGSGGGGAGAAGGAGAPRGVLTATAASPPARPMSTGVPAAAAETATPVQATSARSGVAAAGAGAPMGGGAPMGHHGKAGIGGGHSAADFLHTSDQGGEIVGDLGSVAPPVIGEKDPLDSPEVGLRIG
ncbi:uncharacterized protein RMCC_4941 [Mycolicibacterium canariasense]|uniref:Uncharacterized protein n=1 Tax=Mycolicibacterium canariasense TaxID=228230 RepID=A0A100WGW8_MYCCR|nr:hypothetical protein [Mycolicibacterium canariasense]MCV7212450.1 hypothetical protein [Mycolicibacterium canariasense]GAS97976.1 uncharacterized protein RMCC_4941 [Mycolicibacterium canariasense]